jgi:hypothetical protein
VKGCKGMWRVFMEEVWIYTERLNSLMNSTCRSFSITGTSCWDKDASIVCTA